MIVFLKIQACSIAGKHVFAILVSVTVTVQYSPPRFQYSVVLNTMLRLC